MPKAVENRIEFLGHPMIKSSLYLLRDLWASPVINRSFVLEMGNPTFLQQKSKKVKAVLSNRKTLFYVLIFRKDWIFNSYFALSAMGIYLVESLHQVIKLGKILLKGDVKTYNMTTMVAIFKKRFSFVS